MFEGFSPLGPALVRAGIFSGLILLFGSVVFSWIVLPGAERRLRIIRDQVGAEDGAEPGPPSLPIRLLRNRAATIGVLTSLALIPLVVMRLLRQIEEFRDPFADELAPQIEFLLFDITWGLGWRLQAATVLAAGIFFVGARTRSGGTWWLAAGLTTLVMAITPALSGHANDSGSWTGLAITADTIHILSAGAWMGTLACLAISIPVLRRVDGGSGPVLLSLVQAFSPVALSSAGLVALTGSFAAALRLGSIGAVFGSDYGRILLLKLGLVACVIAAGAFNWRRATPRLLTTAGPKDFYRATCMELLSAVLVIVVTAALVMTQPPIE